MKSIFVSFLSLAIFVGCRHDKLKDFDLPAYQILQSEKLVIPPSVDLPVKLPGQYTRVATYYAVGVQKYRSQLVAGSNPARFEWVFVAPQADLYDITNRKVGTHSAGPTWQLIGSTTDSIYAQQFTPPRTAPSPDPNSIDWLLLMPRIGKVPTGIFSNVSYIQRIDTKGGKAPLKLPTSANETIDVKYTAIYRFTRINP